MRLAVHDLGETVAVGAVTATLVLGFFAGPVAAQEVGEDGTGTPPKTAGEVNEPVPDADAALGLGGELSLSPRRLSLPEGSGRAMPIWPGGRRLFAFTSSNATVWEGVASLDLDSGDVVAERGVEDLVVGRPHLPMPHEVANDPATGHLYVPLVETPAGNEQRSTTGYALLDGETLETIRRLEFSPITVDGRAILPRVQAVAYAPPTGSNGGRLHVLVDDAAVLGTTASLNKQTSPDFYANRVFALQLDPATGRQDWVLEISGCRGQLDVTGTGVHASPGAIFRTPDEDDPAVWVGCYGTGPNSTARIVRVPLDDRGFPPGALPAQPGDPVGAAVGLLADGAVAEDDVAHSAATVEVFPGPAQTFGFVSDPGSQRMVLEVFDGDPNAEVWWVFDGRVRNFVGTVGVAEGYGPNDAVSGLDPATGRMYAFGPTLESTEGGLFILDLRRSPLPQAVQFDDYAVEATAQELNVTPIVVDPATADRPRRALVRPANGSSVLVFEDGIPISQDPSPPTFEGLTADIPEVEGATRANFGGSSQGYGFRSLLVGGLEAVHRLGPVDASIAKNATGVGMPGIEVYPNGHLHPVHLCAENGSCTPVKSGDDTDPAVVTPAESVSTTLRRSDPCSPINRDVSFAFIGPASPVVADGNGTRATAEPVVLDTTTRAQSEVVISSCGPEDWSGLWGSVLVSDPPADEPQLPYMFGDGQASCLSSNEETDGRVEDSLLGSFSAEVDCDDDEVHGYSRARTLGADGVSVADVWTRFLTYRDAERGIVSRVESVVRGISIDGVVSIEQVRAVAETWANGRSQPADVAEDPNCDSTRTAGSCYERSLFGLRTPSYSCGPCGDERAAVEAINRALSGNAVVRMRDPDPGLARGSANGYVAAIQKPDHEKFADLTLNNDLLSSPVPALEIVRFADGATGRGRQVYQFAGVSVASTYGIECLLQVIDGECTQQPAALTLALTDPDAQPLAGGVFELYRDAEAAEAEPPPVPSEEPSQTPSDGATEQPSDDTSPSPDPSESGSPSPDPSESGSPSPDPSESGSPSPDPSDSSSPSPDSSETTSPTDEPSDAPSDDLGGDVPPPVEPPTSLLDPLKDELVGACTTTEDGTGNCTFPTLAPGAYIIHQAAAPPGYMGGPDFPITLIGGDELTVTFTNVSAVGEILIQLNDGAGQALAGGTFELLSDGGAANDAVEGATDTAGDVTGDVTGAVEEATSEPTDDASGDADVEAASADDVSDVGATAGGSVLASCTTDATGACGFTDIDLGPTGSSSFVIHQAAAPAGYLASPDTPVTLNAGESYSLTFVNVEDIGGRIEVSLVDDLTDAPLAGGTFEVYSDDGDGTLGDTDTLYASCATGADGTCAFQGLEVDPAAIATGSLAVTPEGLGLLVPLGGYVIHQSATPDGYAPADDVAFVLDLPGQTAAVAFRNAPPGAGAGEAGPPAVGVSGDFSAGGFSPEPYIAGPTPMKVDVPAPVVAPTNAALGPDLQDFLQAPAQLMGLIVRSPMQAAAFGAVWLLFGAAAAAIRRRLTMVDLIG